MNLMFHLILEYIASAVSMELGKDYDSANNGSQSKRSAPRIQW